MFLFWIYFILFMQLAGFAVLTTKQINMWADEKIEQYSDFVGKRLTLLYYFVSLFWSVRQISFKVDSFTIKTILTISATISGYLLLSSISATYFDLQLVIETTVTSAVCVFYFSIWALDGSKEKPLRMRNPLSWASILSLAPLAVMKYFIYKDDEYSIHICAWCINQFYLNSIVGN